jgi:glycine cleavage system T protein
MKMSEPIQETIRKSPLFDTQKEMGAEFDQFYGWEMARSFDNPNNEYNSVRTGVGLIDLSFCGAIQVGGKEAIQFLNGLVTNDVKALSAGKGMRAAFLTGHGKVRALCRVFGLGEEFLIINDPQTHEKIFKYVFPFSYAGDFKVEDVSDRHRIVSVQGPASLQVMKEVCFEPVPSLDENEWIETIIAGHHVKVARASHTGEIGFDIFVPAAGLKDMWDFILLKGKFHSIVPVGLNALEMLRIEAGIPVYGKDVDETNMMLETGLADAVSYTKGCYTGQEAVAMATYRGHVSKRLSGLAIASDIVPSSGDKLSKAGKEIGYVTSAMRSETLGAVIALAYVKYGYFESGTSVEVQTETETVPATIVDLPFYRRVEGTEIK